MTRLRTLVGLTAAAWHLAAAPAVAAIVRISEDGESVRLSNPHVEMRLEKQSARLRSLTFEGRELLGPGVGYVQIAGDNSAAVQWEFLSVRREAGQADVAFANKSPELPFELEFHYVLRANEPGFHVYFVLGHDAAKHPGVATLGQLNYCLRVDPAIFTTAAVDDKRIKEMPSPGALKEGGMVMDATIRMTNGTVYSKYSYSNLMDEDHRVHGVMGDGFGLWVIMPSHEHVNGGPERQELTVHQTNTTPVLLWMFLGGHYGGGSIQSDAKDGSWKKAGSAFFFMNSGRDPRALWSGAKQRAASEAARWPYPWLDDSLFALERGTVKGRLLFDDRAPVANARVILAPHEEAPDPLLWQQQWRGYRFIGRTGIDGQFALGKVRPGNYDLYAWRPGVIGSFVHTEVLVEKNATANTGDLVWQLPRDRQLLWQIGVPDRSAAGFGGGNDFRRWGLWDEIAERHPDGVTFVVGKNTARDLPFQMAVTQNTDLTWRLPVWRIEFSEPIQRTGEAVLTVAFAESESVQGRNGPHLKISLNGGEIGRIQDLVSDGAAHRSGIHGVYQERQILFDAAKLRPGTNTLTLELLAPRRPVEKRLGYPASAVMFDTLRLEIRK